MSNNTEFKWDDASVLEFVQFTLKNSPLLQGRYTDIEQFKESKQPKPEWEIVKYRGRSSNRIFTKRSNNNWLDESGLVSFDNNSISDENSGCDIFSVKRLSDGMEFSVNDFIEFDDFGPKGAARIDKFEIDPVDNDIVAYNGCYGLGVLHWKKAIPILFTTEDGIDIKIGDKYWYVTKNFILFSDECDSHTGGKFVANSKVGDVFFSTKESACEFILNNKPLFSLHEITTIGNIEDNNPYYKKLVALAESRQAIEQWKDKKEVEPDKEIEYMPVHPDDATKFDCPSQFPMHLLNEDQAQSNHGQTLKRLKERGGLSVKEILAIVNRKKWNYYRDLEWKEAIRMLNDLLTNPTK